MVKTIDDIADELNENVTIKGINELFQVDKQNIDIKTDLTSNEIKQITRLLFIGKTFKIKYLETFLTKYMRLRLSDGRKSRKEIIDMVKSDMQNDLNSNPFNKLKGFMGGGLR